MSFTVTVDATQIDDLRKRYAEIANKMPAVFAKGMTNATYDAKNAVYGIMPSVLDVPTPWTMRSLFVFPAEKEDLRSAVAFKHEYGKMPRSMLGTLTALDAPSAMRSQVYGMDRKLKGFEKTLQRAGLSPAGKPFLVPAVGAEKNKYGNVTTSFINKVYYTSARGGNANMLPFSGGGSTRSRAAKAGTRYFIMGDKGIYRTVTYNSLGGGLTSDIRPLPVFLFSRQPQYKKRLAFHETVNSTVNKQLDPRITTALVDALKKYWSNK